MKTNTTYQIIRQTTPQTITNNATLAAITALLGALVASGVYKYRITLLVKGFANSSIQVAVVGPSSNTMHAYGLSSVTPKSTADGGAIDVTLVDNTPSVITIEGIIQNGVNAGNLQVEAAQETAEANNTVIEAGSCLEIWRIDPTNPPILPATTQ